MTFAPISGEGLLKFVTIFYKKHVLCNGTRDEVIVGNPNSPCAVPTRGMEARKCSLSNTSNIIYLETLLLDVLCGD